MAKKDKAEDTRQRRNARPGDPSYQAPRFASEEELAVLEQGPEARRDAVLRDIEAMHKAQRGE